MDSRNFEKELLLEKQGRFMDAVMRTSRKLGVSVPEIKFWDGYCPHSQGEEIAHIHVEERLICISNYRLKSMSYDDIDGTAVHETTHLVENSHNQDFQNEELDGNESLWHSRKAGEEVDANNTKDIREITLEKVKRFKSK